MEDMEKSAEEKKLREALAICFGTESTEDNSVVNEAKKYVKMRIRSVMEILIEEEDTDKMEILEEWGWLGERELNSFIKAAQDREKPGSLMWLMHLKNRKYGYKQEKFSL